MNSGNRSIRKKVFLLLGFVSLLFVIYKMVSVFKRQVTPNTSIETSLSSENSGSYRTSYSETEDYFFYIRSGYVVSGIIPKDWQVSHNFSDDVNSEYDVKLSHNDHVVNISRYMQGMGCIYPDSSKYSLPSNPKFPYEGKTKKLYEIKNIYGRTYRLNEFAPQVNFSVSTACVSDTGNPDSYTSSTIYVQTPTVQNTKDMESIKGIIKNLLIVLN